MSAEEDMNVSQTAPVKAKEGSKRKAEWMVLQILHSTLNSIKIKMVGWLYAYVSVCLLVCARVCLCVHVCFVCMHACVYACTFTSSYSEMFLSYLFFSCWDKILGTQSKLAREKVYFVLHFQFTARHWGRSGRMLKAGITTQDCLLFHISD